MSFLKSSFTGFFLSLKYIFYSIITFLFFFLLIGFAIYQSVDLNKLKKDVLKALEEKSDLKIEYVSNQLVIFPSPGIEFEYINIYDNDEKIAELNKLLIQFSIWELIQGKFEIDGMELHSGKLYLYRDSLGNLDVLSGFMKKESKFNPDDIKTKLDEENIDQIESQKIDLTPESLYVYFPDTTKLDNIHIDFVDDFYKNRYSLYIWKSNFSISPFTRTANLDIYGKINNRKFEIYSDFYWEENEFSYNSLRGKATVILDVFNLSLLDDVLVIFPNGDFNQTIVSGRLYFEKKEEDLSRLQVKDCLFENFALPKRKPFGKILVNTWIAYSAKKHRLMFDDISVFWKNRASLTGNGFLTFDSNPIIQFKVKSEYADLDHIFKFVSIWTDTILDRSALFRDLPDTGYDKKFRLNMDLNLKNVFYSDLRFPYLNTRINYHYPKILLNYFDFAFNEGNVSGSGEVLLFSGEPKIYLDVKMLNFAVDSLIARRTDNKYITGNLESNFQLKSTGSTEETILNNLSIRGEYNLTKGELIGYLNFLKPLASLGKIINFTGPPGNSLEYDSLRGTFSYKNRLIQFTNMKMKGVGLDAEGVGKIDLDGKMDIRITVALSGVAGKILKLPIIYKGIFGRNLPYVDPIWLGSVYAGTVFLAGPAGAAVGGIAGSAASDYINKAMSTIKGIFSFSKKEEEEEF
ncbi:MAG: AsmA-like C-terminal region-containing protein [Leptospira sp.]|nr:AsmA-like C-terminal region-containing protein [Leptospira sp.]